MKNVNLKKLLSLLLAVAFVLSLTACKGVSVSGNSSAPEVTLHYEDYDLSDQYSAASNAAVYKGDEEWESVTLVMSCDGDTDSSQAEAGRYFNALMQHSTGGRVRVTVQPSSGLSGGNAEEAIQKLMYGDEIQLCMQSSLTYAQFDPRLSVASLPFLFPSEQIAVETLSGSAGKQLKEIMLQYGMMCLGIGENGFLQLISTRSTVTKAKDLSALTVSSNGNELIDYELGQLFTMADSSNSIMETILDAPAVTSNQRYVTLWNLSYDPVYFCINQNTYSRFTEDQKKVITSNASKAIEYQIAMQQKNEAERLTLWRSNDKVHIRNYDELDMESLKEKVSKAESWYTKLLMQELSLSKEAAVDLIDRFHLE